MTSSLFAFVVAAGLALASLPQDKAAQAAVEPPKVIDAELGATRNVHRAGDLWLGGQFTEADIARLKAAGIQRVITLRTPGEVAWEEERKLEAAGIQFQALPIDGVMDDGTFESMRALLKQDAGSTLLHCGSANRVAGAWIPYRVLDQGVSIDQAVAEADEIGLRNPAYRDAALAYIESQTSVKEGINDSFLDPELDVDKFIGRFEVESREVYSERHAILAACNVQPGMRVADVGSGTGLYTFLFADAVGPAGWVYGVDIAPRFVEHVRELAVSGQVKNVSSVLGAGRSITLPPASVDLVYTCDTYHHFEYPRPVLDSIRRALTPGGRFVVVDFERIPGVSREWILGHVRAPKETVRAEIEGAGFAFVREAKIPGLKETYFLEFRVPAER